MDSGDGNHYTIWTSRFDIVKTVLYLGIKSSVSTCQSYLVNS